MAKKNTDAMSTDDDFSFDETSKEDLFPGAGTAEDKKDYEGPSTDYLELAGAGMMKWLVGEMDTRPEEIKKLGDDLATKMNWYLAMSAISMLEGVPYLLRKKRLLEKALGPDIDIASDPNEILKYHRSVSVELKEIMEYARRFIKENKDFLTDNSDFFDRKLFEEIKSMGSELVKDYLTFFSIIDKRGHNLLKELIKKYSE